MFTGRYPARIFDFNVGVMRWTWRVTFYAYGALGTDRYPPFTLADVTDYPAHLEVVRLQRLSRGLVLVKWWLLALPHYFVVAFFVGGGLFAVDAASQDSRPALWAGGLIGLLVLVAAITLLVTGKYPKPIFDLIIGLQRWVIRVAGYAALMTDEYPPFRLDQGGDDGPGSPAPDPGAVPSQPVAPQPVGARRSVVTLVLGGLAVALGAMLAAAAGVVFVADRALADDDGFWMTPDVSYSSGGYAITPESVDLGNDDRSHRMMDGPDGRHRSSGMVGDAKLVVAPVADEGPLFVGIAPTADVQRYLEGVARSTLLTVEWIDGRGRPTFREMPGGAPSTAPAEQSFWTESAHGSGRQSISFPLQDGSWTAVVMRADGSRGVTAEVRAGASFAAFGWVLAALLGAAGVFLLLGLAVLLSRTTGTGRNRREPGSTV